VTRWVLDVNLDQFIAGVEVLRHPKLGGRHPLPHQLTIFNNRGYEFC
jgi:hypothetical protein